MAIINFLILCILLLVAYYDFKYKIIPNVLVLYLLGLNLLWILGKGAYVDYLYGGLISGLLFLFIYLVTGNMGAGDVKLAMVVGLWLGWFKALIFIYLGLIAGGIWAVVLCLRYRRRKIVFPFAPALVLAALVANYFTENILLWWLQLLSG